MSGGSRRASAPFPGAGCHPSTASHTTEPFLHVLEKANETLELKIPPGSPRPSLSVGRDFSAPIRIDRNLTREDRLALVKAETDPFNKWEAGRSLASQ
jgi:aminopeptidase N